MKESSAGISIRSAKVNDFFLSLEGQTTEPSPEEPFYGKSRFEKSRREILFDSLKESFKKLLVDTSALMQAGDTDPTVAPLPTSCDNALTEGDERY